MTIVGQVKKGMYFDSITLMTVGVEITEIPGITDATVVMGTEGNKAILAAAGMWSFEFEEAGENDLLIAAKVENEESAGAIQKVVEQSLERTRKQISTHNVHLPKSFEGAFNMIPDANLALISVAGQYAYDEALKALEKGLHVMIFSDHVSLEKEIELKQIAREKGLLVMGPDCGTAIINGAPLAFANVVSQGNIGIVAASGTGLQEVSCIISNEGGGVSQGIGVGGRDVKNAVGGIMFLEALKALLEEETTKVVLLVSKPPDSNVLNLITEEILKSKKAVVCCFLGTTQKIPGLASTLEEAALHSVALSKDEAVDTVLARTHSRNEALQEIANQEGQKRRKGQQFVRGLFSGGTLCLEAQVLFKDRMPYLYSNVPIEGISKLAHSLESQMNTLIDLGEDEFTEGRLHPMMDYSFRQTCILKEAADPQTAVILLDIVLGYGAHPDPGKELFDTIQEACKKVSVVCSITGTDQDPQNKRQVENALQDAGALVLPTNAAACTLTGYIIQSLTQ